MFVKTYKLGVIGDQPLTSTSTELITQAIKDDFKSCTGLDKIKGEITLEAFNREDSDINYIINGDFIVPNCNNSTMYYGTIISLKIDKQLLSNIMLTVKLT
jgi:hypothetical protein